MNRSGQRESTLILSVLLSYLFCHLLTLEFKVIALTMILVKTNKDACEFDFFFSRKKLDYFICDQKCSVSICRKMDFWMTSCFMSTVKGDQNRDVSQGYR